MADPVVLMDHRCVHEPTPGFTHRGCDERAERRLVLAAQTGGAPERAALVEVYLPLIGSVARLYRESRVVERAELMQEGVVGLLRALQRYDSSSARRSGRTRRGGCGRRCRSWSPS